MYKDVQRSIVQNSKIMKNPDVYYQEKEHLWIMVCSTMYYYAAVKMNEL